MLIDPLICNQLLLILVCVSTTIVLKTNLSDMRTIFNWFRNLPPYPRAFWWVFLVLFFALFTEEVLVWLCEGLTNAHRTPLCNNARVALVLTFTIVLSSTLLVDQIILKHPTIAFFIVIMALSFILSSIMLTWYKFSQNSDHFGSDFALKLAYVIFSITALFAFLGKADIFNEERKASSI